MKSVYDYIIVGAGAAGLHLALAILRDENLVDKQVLILDKDEKSVNDKTWSYWEQGAGKWDHLLEHQWSHGYFNYLDQELALTLYPYHYKQIRSLSFYDFAKQEIGKSGHMHFLQADVISVVNELEQVLVTTDLGEFRAAYCFDSRLSPDFVRAQDGYIRIWQHFKGHRLRFNEDVFDPETFRMMDFRAQHEESCSFMYVLPTSKREALVEFTFFTPGLVEEVVYDEAIKSYAKQYIGSDRYQILESEKGVIPMTDYPFHKDSQGRLVKIGTAGGWVRASTGYSFKNAERYTESIVSNLVAERNVMHGVLSAKSRWQDAVLLNILNRKNHLLPGIFHQMYARNQASMVLKFLDGETSKWEDLQIIKSLNPWPFLESSFNYYFR